MKICATFMYSELMLMVSVDVSQQHCFAFARADVDMKSNGELIQIKIITIDLAVDIKLGGGEVGELSAAEIDNIMIVVILGSSISLTGFLNRQKARLHKDGKSSQESWSDRSPSPWSTYKDNSVVERLLCLKER
ncbi:hypothetical protein Leryth_022486 [Lithospermum erythrorhizon]|nr:hypothetical protein Leryth_022486 [Lithospermum erythrorhizon]